MNFSPNKSIILLKFKTTLSCFVILLLMSLATNTINAQNSLQDPSRVPEKKAQPEIQKPAVEPTTNNTVTKAETKTTQVETQPYTNYKGISDPAMAKDEWVKDNPEEYARMLQETAINKPVVNEVPAAQTQVQQQPTGRPVEGSAPKNNQ